MKPFDIITAPQRSPEWRQARAGRATGSRAKDILATIKSGESAARRDYRLQLVTERLTGEPQDDGFVNAAMQWGIDHEDDAFAVYQALTGEFAERTGFLAHRTLRIGCSLDGHLGNFDRLLEIKAPKSATHLGYLRTGGIPADHLAQLRHNLYVTGASGVDFLSFDPRFPAELRTFLVRLEAKDANLPAYESALVKFLSEVDTEEASLRGWSVMQESA